MVLATTEANSPSKKTEYDKMSLTTLLQNDLGYCDPALKKRFHREAKKLLRIVAKTMGLSAKDYDLSSNMAGTAVSGEITLHTDSLYISVGQRYMANGCDVLVRACEGRKDYTGKKNHWVPASALDDAHLFTAYLKNISSDFIAAWGSEEARSDAVNTLSEKVTSYEVETACKQYDNGEIDIADVEHVVSQSAKRKSFVMPVQIDLF